MRFKIQMLVKIDGTSRWLTMEEYTDRLTAYRAYHEYKNHPTCEFRLSYHRSES